MKYLSDEQNKRFLGTGQLNNEGKSLEAFLNEYDPKKYMSPCNTVDTLVFTYIESNGIKKINRILLIKRANHPSIGWWALPGGFVDYRENLDVAALRELKEETGIEDLEVEQLKCYGDYDRDPRARIITTAYITLVPEGKVKPKAGDDAKDADWFYIEDECVGKNVDSRNNVVAELYDLKLWSDNSGINLESKILRTYKEHDIFKQEKYMVKETNLLAADHGAIILEGYHYLKNKLK